MQIKQCACCCKAFHPRSLEQMAAATSNEFAAELTNYSQGHLEFVSTSYLRPGQRHRQAPQILKGNWSQSKKSECFVRRGLNCLSEDKVFVRARLQLCHKHCKCEAALATEAMNFETDSQAVNASRHNATRNRIIA